MSMNDPLNDVYSDLVDAVNSLNELSLTADSDSYRVLCIEWEKKLESVMGEIMKFQSLPPIPKGKLTRAEFLEGLADRGIDTWDEYNNEV